MVQVLVIVSGLGHTFHDDGGDHNVEHLVLDSKKRVEQKACGQRPSMAWWREETRCTRGDVLLGGEPMDPHQPMYL